jgi:hypothetical protein
VSAKIVYKDIAPGSDSDAAVTATGADAKSTVSLLPTGVIHPDFATLEMNKWGGSGSKKVYNSQPIAMVSSAMSGTDCTFSTPPTLTIIFDSNYTSLGIFLRFSTNSIDYAKSVTITWYQGATQLAQKTFTPDGPSYFCENTVTAYNKVIVAINSTNLPGRYARLEQILFGTVRVFDKSEFGSVSILQETDLISAELSINTMDWKLQNKVGVDYIFQLKQPVLVYNDSNLIGVFYIDDKVTRTAEKAYEIPCNDAIGILDGDTFSAVMYSSKNAVTAMNEIVNGIFALDIDASFSSTTLTGYIPSGTRRTALQQVCFAIGAVISTAGTDKIKIIPVPSTSSTIAANNVYSAGSISQDSIVTSVVVTYHTYTAGSGSSGDDVITVGGTKYVHTTGTVTVSNPNVTSSDKPNVKTFTDCTLVNSSIASTVANRVYNYYVRRNTAKSKIVVTDEEPGGLVSVPTQFGTISGNIKSMKIKLSNTTAADVEILEVS